MSLERAAVMIGSDPEAFITQNGVVVGAESIIPETGWGYGGARIVRDGVQLEMHLTQGEDIYEIARSLYNAFYMISAQFSESKSKGYTLCMDEVVVIPESTWESLSPESRILGCKPSLNIYDGQNVIEVSPEFRMRSASGHLHLGLERPIWSNGKSPYVDNRRYLVPMLDWVVGNFCVLLNRGEAQKIRRTVYGRSGEYRLPEHGLEYRVPSNFWTLDPILLYMVFGLTQFVIDVYNTALVTRKPLDDRLMKDFTVESCRTAIDNNDHVLAQINFECIVPFLEEHARGRDPLNKETIPHFRKFLTNIPALMEKTWKKTTTVERWMKWNPESETGDVSKFLKKF